MPAQLLWGGIIDSIELSVDCVVPDEVPPVTQWDSLVITRVIAWLPMHGYVGCLRRWPPAGFVGQHVSE